MKKTYFNHDSNARNDIRIIKLRAKLGYTGYGLFWAVLEILFTEENKLCMKDYNSLAFGLQCDVTILKQVIEDFDLFVIEDDCFYSKRLYKHIEEINTKSKQAKENVLKRWNKDKNIQTNNNGITSKSKSKEKKNKENDILLRLQAFQKKVFDIDNIDIEDKKAFIDYWTESNKSGTKLRFEMEKTWDLSRRIKRWTNSSFNKNKKNKFPDYFDEFLFKKLNNNDRHYYEQHLKELGWKSIYNPNAGQKWVGRDPPKRRTAGDPPRGTHKQTNENRVRGEKIQPPVRKVLQLTATAHCSSSHRGAARSVAPRPRSTPAA